MPLERDREKSQKINVTVVDEISILVSPETALVDHNYIHSQRFNPIPG